MNSSSTNPAATNSSPTGSSPTGSSSTSSSSLNPASTGSASRLHGVIPPVVTPFTTDGDVDTTALRALTEHLLGQGVHGIFPLGSTGEVAYLTDSQRRLVLETVVETVAGRVPVLGGCIDLTAARVAEQARTAQSAGVDAVVVTTPLYALNDQGETADHFRHVRSAVEVPVLAYDVPVRAHGRPGLDTLIDLALEGVIAGVKDSSGDDVGFRRLLRANRAAGSPLVLFTGHELMCDAMLLLGADGLVPGLGNVDAGGYVRLYDAARAGDFERAVVEQEQLAQLFEIVFAVGARSADARGVGAFKTAMVELGLLPSAAMASPVRVLDHSDQEAVAAVVRQWRSVLPEGAGV